MGFIAVVSAGESEPGQPPPGLGVVGGITLLERQVRAVLDAGAEEVAVLVAALPSDVAGRLAAETRCWRVSNPVALAERFAGDARDVVVFAPAVLLDERLIAAVARSVAPVLFDFASNPPAAAERLDSQSHWAGIARLKADMVAAVAADLGDWELTGTLVRAAVESGAARLNVESLPVYAPLRRRDAEMLWFTPLDPAARGVATDALIAASQKGCLDWPARFIHPPIENALVRLFLSTRITPNMVTLATGILGVLAIILFATGDLWWGLGLVLVVGPLDGVDGKLARTRHEFSRWGDLEHVLDKILEYGWFIALGSWFAQEHGLAAWLATAGIILLALSEAASGEFFRRFTGKQLDDWGPFERRLRLIAGRRNTFFWSLLPFAAFGAWWPGFLFILVYAGITTSVAQWRLFKALGEFGRAVSSEVAHNFARTAYAFLPKSGAGGR